MLIPSSDPWRGLRAGSCSSNEAVWNPGGRVLPQYEAPCCVYSRAHIAILLRSSFTYARIRLRFIRFETLPFFNGKGGIDLRAWASRAQGPPGARCSSLFRGPGNRVTDRGARAMSIDTLLEAARYLEWEARQQHSAPGELRSAARANTQSDV